MDQATRNKLRNVVTQCRKILEQSVAETLQGQFGIFASGRKGAVKIEDEARMSHLSEEDRACRKDLIDHLQHVEALGYKSQEALAQLVREIAFTHLNRLCAYKMMEARGLIREAVSRGVKSQGFLFYLADHPEDEKRYNSGQQDVAYRHFLDWLGGTLSEEIGVLFNPNDPANRLHPPQRILDQIIGFLNGDDIKPDETDLRQTWPEIWSQDETIGWVYQYFTPKELRDQARKQSAAPRNSYELAFRNQFFTPRYVVEFLADNTLGRIWYEMRQGQTTLTKQCCHMVCRPNEVFLAEDEGPPVEAGEIPEDLSQEELLQQPVYFPYRPKKDPRELKILDPACGSAHFLLYCFDLLQTIYEEAYNDPDLGPVLKKDFPDPKEYRKAMPGLILAFNLHGIDIDLRATQIAALALWLRCQRAFQEAGIHSDRPPITRSNIVCAEPMPGETEMLREFVSDLHPKVLGQLVEVVFDRMTLAGEAGSLLKIEIELAKAIAEAKRQWLEGPKDDQLMLFDIADEKPTQGFLFDLSGISDEEFWDEAESRVFACLEKYSTKAANGNRLQRRLFADDAERGFALVDICRTHFDVVLMNPPFGEVSVTSRSYLYQAYDNASQDIFSAFVDRGIELLHDDGLLGAITSRLAFFLELLEAWRKRICGSIATLTTMADLGYGVLDDALVEAAAYVVRNRKSLGVTATFLNMLACEDKGNALRNMCQSFHANAASVHIVDTLSFLDVPASRASYWVSGYWRKLFDTPQTMHSTFGFPFVGLQTGNDEMFLRLHWEVPSVELASDSPRWVSFAKGGDYSPFYGDYHLILDWSLREKARRQSNSSAYFKPGVTYTERTTSDLSARVLPPGCVFSPNGVTISTPADNVLQCTFLLNTRVVQFMVEMCVGSGDAVHSGSAARHYGPRIVARIPIPSMSAKEGKQLAYCAKTIWCEIRDYWSAHEPDRYFVSPFRFSSCCSTLQEGAEKEWTAWERIVLAVIEQSHKGEQLVNPLFGVSGSLRKELDEECGSHPAELPERPVSSVESERFADEFLESIDNLIDRHVQVSGASRFLTKKTYIVDRRIELLAARYGVHPKCVVELRQRQCLLLPSELRSFAERVVSYSLGVALGRWDVRIALDEERGLQLPGPLDPLPAFCPAMLVDDQMNPSLESIPGYPVAVDWDGILVDDADHQDDTIRRIRDVLEVIWIDGAEAIEKEACEILGVKRLRDYFRKPTSGGFWDDHVKRYSKSRRKAPIYWLLQSAKKNYALWLYYHRLDKDMFFKALVNYVEPKIRLEENRLDSLRAQKSSGGSKKLDRDIEKQEDLLSELRDFEEKLRRVANLHLEPDLNDGVVLNIAPLWELVPWKEAKKYWEELLAGKYEWSTIGKQLREKGVISDG